MITNFKSNHVFQADDPGQGGGGIGTSAPPADAPTDPVPPAGAPPRNEKTIEDQIKTLELTLAKERDNAKLAEQRARQAAQEANQYRSVLGEYSPERLTEVQEALDRSAKWEAELSRVEGEAKRKKDEEYNQQIKELETKVQIADENLYTLEKRLAIQDWFDKTEVKGLSSELKNLIQLAGHRFEFDKEKKKIVKVLDENGKEMFVNGNPATPQDLMLEMRQGKYGSALAGCFAPYNQGGGGGLPLTGPNGQPIHNPKDMTPSDRLTMAFNQNGQR